MPTDTARVQDLLDAAARLQAQDRERFLAEQCGGDGDLRRELDSLLAALERAPDVLGAPPVRFGAGARREKPGDAIGPYTLVEPIGEGGFGTVYLAEQARPVRRSVALKVIKPGMDTRQVVARFEAERQALAMMDHPNIARVFEAGATESGRPYFVMELVRGTPITRYCDDRRLDVPARVRLLVEVCSAVQHAHQKGVIHRDLKPTNILVAEQDGRPVAKVIDFGVAKALRQPLTGHTSLLTQEGRWVGTPAYMSPEQFGSGAGVDTRTDVYSLGVLLYELLTGTTPLRLDDGEQPGPSEIERRAAAEAPPPVARLGSLGGGAVAEVAAARSTTPAGLRAAARGDLAWIVRRCLEPDPSRRYPSAEHLAEELRRHLAGLPVEAGPPGTRYRLSKFFRRHRRAVAMWALFLVAAASVGWGLAMRHAFGPDSRIAITDLYQRGEDLRLMGRMDEAEVLFRQAMAKVDRRYGPYDPANVNVLWNLIQLLNDQGRYEEALEYDRRLLEMARRGELSPGKAADLSDWYGGKLYLMGRYDEAREPLAESVAIQEKSGFQRTSKYRMTLERLAFVCDRVGRPQEAARWRAKLAQAPPPAPPTPRPRPKVERR
jgi:serine/threonine protein kinase